VQTHQALANAKEQTMAASTSPSDPYGAAPGVQDFSLVLGGPLYQLLRRARLSDARLGLVNRRIVLAVLLMWAPLLALSAVQGVLLGPARTMPFLDDIGTHLRFLVVTPLLIVAELVVYRRITPIVDQFTIRRLILPQDTARYADALSEAKRLRDSVLAEVIMVALVFAAGGLFTLRRYVDLGGGAWYASTTIRNQLSLAGLWLVFVSLPLIQFLLLRWYFRLFIWARFLWRVARLDLDLEVTHPDKAGGLGFLADSLNAFIPLAAAHGVLFAGMLANRILFGGAKLTDFEIEVFGGGVFLIFVFAGPLAVFGPRLARVRRAGLRAYGALGQSYVRAFRIRWLGDGAPPAEELLGSGDIQSLADLGNSFGAAEQMRIVPITPAALLYFAAAFFLPIAPLVLTMTSVEKLIGRLVGLVF
jgi:hypothetical protein